MSATPMNRGELRNLYRFGVFALALAVGVTSLGARMFYLQVVQGGQQDYQGSDTSQSTADQPIASTRGLIFDSQGRPLVKNVVDYSVTVTPIDLPIEQEELVAQRLGSILTLDPIYIETAIDSSTGSLYVPVKIADGISARVARFIEENYDNLPGVRVDVTSKRQYLSKQLFAQIIGYEGQITKSQYDQLKLLDYYPTDIVGQAGLENYYEQDLRGSFGDQTVALDSSGKPIPGLVTPGRDPVPGDSLTLNIDGSEQRYAQEALQWGLTNSTSSYTKVTKGVIIVENPQNGKILAMVSLPSYDDQLFADGISATDFQALLSNPDQPLLNKAIGAQYAPGSTFKLVTGTAGVQNQPSCQFYPTYCSGNFTDTSTLLSQPYIQIGDRKYWEWNLQGWGPLDITDGVAYSSDTFFYQLAELVGLDRLTYWADQYGFGRPTGIDLPETATGIVPTNSWKLANLVDDVLESKLDFAFDEHYGYLSCCPTNVGTGLRASVMMHLPALAMTNQASGVFTALSKVGFVVRGLYGEGTEAKGNLFQISNQITLGLSEMEILDRLVTVSRQVIEQEQMGRRSLMKERPLQIEDMVFRAYGVLANARLLNSEETMFYLSCLRLAIDLGLLHNVSNRTLNELLVRTRTAFLQGDSKGALDAFNRSLKRAAIIRVALATDPFLNGFPHQDEERGSQLEEEGNDREAP